MKTKNILFLIALLATINAFSQNKKVLYTLCGKSGDCEITLEEFGKCKKELISMDESMKIVSFNVLIKVNGGYQELLNMGAIFNNEMVKILPSQAGAKILIEDVRISQGDKVLKVLGMAITLK